MKKKELEKLIKSSYEEATPDIISKIDFKKIEIEPQKERRKTRKGFASNLAFALSVFAVMLAVLVSSAVFYKPGTPGEQNDETPLEKILEPNLNYQSFESKQSVVSFSSIMGVNLYNTGNSQAQNLRLAAKDKFVIEEDLDNLNNLLSSLSGFLENAIVTVDLGEDDPYFDSNYQVNQKVTITTQAGTNVYIVQYTSEVDDDDDDDDDEEEIEVEFEGKVILNPEGTKVTFLLEGKNSQEEGETEVEYKLYQEDDDDNYILFKQETVERKQKFTYEIYFKDKTEIITKMYIGLDYENKTHIFLETEDKIKDSKAKYNIKEEGDYLIGSYEIDYLDDDEEGTIKISYVDGNNQYEITSDDVTITRIKPFSGFIQTRKKLALFT
ncbi:MAG: hypothetical protein PHY38_00680 [Bacilli bacterium]|nr:hypothetical protein [Bacilli bacterium]